MNIKEIGGKQYIFCPWRKKYVRYTPEEYVRQQFLHLLVDVYHYPEALIAVEVKLTTGRRADAVVYNQSLKPRVLIEFKAEKVALTPKVLDQIAVYNRQFSVPYLILSNGPDTVVARVENAAIQFMDAIPAWEEINQ